MIAWATASVTTSASVTIRLALPALLRQEIVGDAEHKIKQQVEVGEHRGSSLESAVTERTADFDQLRYVSFNPMAGPRPVKLLIEAAPSGRHDERAGYLRPLDARRESASPATASDALVISRV